MSNGGLLFIPDISGFTDFINKTEIAHSRYIIQELLEVLINSNEIGLQISEIEGDAILFYRYGKSPGIEEIRKQVEEMFCDFHRYLNRYAKLRICQCKACKSAPALTLKIITHQGEFTSYNVKEYSKLLGKDVIIAHQLLKNDIPVHEYWLVSENVVDINATGSLPQKLEWQSGKKITESGEINFHYSLLTKLKQDIVFDEQPFLGIRGKRVKIFTLEKELNENIDKVFSVIMSLPHRVKWIDGITAVEKISDHINQLGTKHHCVMGKNVNVLFTSSFEQKDDMIIVEETDPKRTGSCSFTLQKLAEDRTRITADFYLKNNPFLLGLFRVFSKRKLENSLNRSLCRLAEFVTTPEAAECYC